MRTLYGLTALCFALLGVAAEPTPDERILTENKIPTDGPGLVKYLRNLVIDDATEARLKKLVKQLGDDDFDTREEATRQLAVAGAAARPFLQEALKNEDAEVVGRARKCLEQIEKSMTSMVTSAAVRVMAQHKPEGAAETLFRYLPAAEDESVAQEVRLALAAVAPRDGKPEPILVAGLADKSPVKRGAAGAALARANVADQRDAVKKLLQDPDSVVRLRVGLALATRDKDAIPALIALLDNNRLSPGHVGSIEDVLYRLAEDKAPLVGSGSDEASRKKNREAWEGWWKEHGAKIDAAKLEEAAKTRNFTLVVLLDKGIVRDLDAGKNPRWQIDDLRLPLDVQLLPGERVLVAEHDGGRVTERNRANEVLWDHKIDSPLVAQRLPNGNTFIATRTQILELDGDKKVVYNYFPPNGELVMRAQKSRNGEIALEQMGGPGNVTTFVRLDSKRQPIKSIGVNVRTSGGRIDVLPNGNILVPENAANRVIEIDPDGKIVWEVSIDRPVMAMRLPSGHTMVTSMNEAIGAVEFDRMSKQVWQYKTDTRVTRAYRH